MRIFKIAKDIEVVCESQRTRNGFRHLATLMKNGREQDTAKCCYLNRTWERYEFQSVLSKLVDKTSYLSDEEKTICKAFIEGDQTDWSDFKMVSNIAKLGEIFCDNQKDKNDWKERMIKAGFEHKGLIMPDDWNTLDEDTKQKRLNDVIELMGDVSKNE
jgi:hypothetical protein